MLNRFKLLFQKKILRLDAIDKIEIQSYTDELNRQSLRFLPFIHAIFLGAWIPYIFIDSHLHPYFFPFVLTLRLGLSVTGLASLILFWLKPLKNRTGIRVLIGSGIYLLFATAVITGLSRGESTYFGGLLFIMMSLILIPLPYPVLWTLIVGGFGVFTLTAFLAGTAFDRPSFQYGFTDLSSAALVAMLFIFLVDQIRRKSYVKSKELEKERNYLKQQNDVLEEELNMAKNIQENLLPSRTPSHQISSLYKPMSQLGGDFFDFILFPDSSRMGIFLSDVSGHGVPAAFITSMVKSFLLKAGEDLEHPARLMSYLNENLYNQTSGHFMTAFYGIYHRDEQKITYCNAGHNLPFLVETNSVSFFSQQNKSLPLAVFSNAELQNLNKAYQNQSMAIPPKSRMIFYTDGLVETVNIHEPEPDFGAMDLIHLLKESLSDSPEICLARIYEKLIEFRGSQELEDDVCVICVDT